MRLLGSLTELVFAIFRQNSVQITVRPNASTTYSVDRVVSLPNQNADCELVSLDAVQALTNKTLTSPKVNENVVLTSTATELNQLDGVSVGGTTPTDIVTLGATQTLTGKTIDGDDNTVQDLAVSSLKTVVGNADKVLTFAPTTGVPQTSKIVDANVDATAAIGWSKISKSGSNLTDIATRSHTSLSDIGTTTHANIDIALSASSSHIGASTGVHGVSGSVVGTSDAQTLTNKDVDGGTASNSLRITVPKGLTATLNGLTRKEGTVLYSTDDKVMYYDNGTTLSPIGSTAVKQTKTLADNQITPTDPIFSVAVATYQNVLVKFSLSRATGQRCMGQMFLMYDGTDAHLTVQSVEALDCGVTFSADVSGGNIRLLYTTTSTGNSCSMVYFLDQWAN